MLGDGAPQALGHAAGGTEALGQRRREGAVLADGQVLGPQVVGAQRGDDVGRGRVGIGGRHGEVGSGEHPVFADDDGLAAVHRPDRGPHIGGQGALADEGELGVEDDADRPTGHRGRGGVRADAALGPHGAVGARDEGLDEHERGEVADAATALGALGHEAGRAGGEGGVGLVRGPDLGEDAAAGGHPAGDGGGVGDEHGGERGGQLGRVERAPVGDARRRARRSTG